MPRLLKKGGRHIGLSRPQTELQASEPEGHEDGISISCHNGEVKENRLQATRLPNLDSPYLMTGYLEPQIKAGALCPRLQPGQMGHRALYNILSGGCYRTAGVTVE